MLEAKPFYLIADQRGTANKLADKLTAIGVHTQVVAQPPPSATYVIYLAGIDPALTIDEALELNRKAFQAARLVGQSMQQAKHGIWIMVQDTGGSFSLQAAPSAIRSWSGGLAALAKTAKQEWPKISVKCIDIASQNNSAEQIAETLLAELIYGGADLEVGYPDRNTRIVVQPKVEQSALALNPPALDSPAVMVVTGGARGVTAQCLIELLKRNPLKVAIMGTTTLKPIPDFLARVEDSNEISNLLFAQAKNNNEKITPADLRKRCQEIVAIKEINKNLAAMKQLGAQVHYYTADVSDMKSVNNALAKISEELGDIKILVHAAGTLADKLIHEKSDEQFNKVFNTKVVGLRNLLAATQEDQLTHLICFSSVAARTGNAGQADYAMANEVLNKVCQVEAKRRGKNCLVRTIAWGPWDGGMVSPELKAHFSANGIDLIPIKAGAEAFVNEFLSRYPDDQVEVVRACSLDKWSADRELIDGFYAIWVQQANYPYLSSHVIWNKTITPMVLVYEWALKLAEQLIGESQTIICQKLAAKKPLELTQCQTQGDKLQLHWRQKKDESSLHFTCWLTKSDDPAIYFNFDLVSAKAKSLSSHIISNHNAATKISVNEVYQTILFHKKYFQVIKEAVSIDELQINALLKCKHKQALKDLRSNIFYLDGGLQLVVIWMYNRYGVSSLPLSIEEIEQLADWSAADEIHCTAQILEHNNFTVKADIRFFTLSGDCVAVMRGVYCMVTADKFHPSKRKKVTTSEV